MGSSGVFQRRIHPPVLPSGAAVVARRGCPRCACQMQSRLSSHQFPTLQGSGLRCGSHLLCRLLTSPRQFSGGLPPPSSGLPRNTVEISRGKTRILPRIGAGFTKCTHPGVAAGFADGGLGGHVPTGPGCITPHIRFLFIAPRFRLGLPPHPASRRRTCPSTNLRLC